MTTTALDKELLDLEKAYWEAVKTRDAGMVERLSDDRCVVIGPRGIGEYEKAEVAAMVKQDTHELRRFTFDESALNIRPLGTDTALVAYRVKRQMVIDGKSTDLESFDASVWTKRDGKWVCGFHVETPVGV